MSPQPAHIVEVQDGQPLLALGNAIAAGCCTGEDEVQAGATRRRRRRPPARAAALLQVSGSGGGDHLEHVTCGAMQRVGRSLDRAARQGNPAQGSRLKLRQWCSAGPVQSQNASTLFGGRTS